MTDMSVSAWEHWPWFGSLSLLILPFLFLLYAHHYRFKIFMSHHPKYWRGFVPFLQFISQPYLFWESTSFPCAIVIKLYFFSRGWNINFFLDYEIMFGLCCFFWKFSCSIFVTLLLACNKSFYPSIYFI